LPTYLVLTTGTGDSPSEKCIERLEQRGYTEVNEVRIGDDDMLVKTTPEQYAFRLTREPGD
jgi:hypothetical protein